MAKIRCGPKSIYTTEQEAWIEEAKDEFLHGVQTRRGKQWESKWKRDKAEEFVNKFRTSLNGEPESWENVSIFYYSSIYLSAGCCRG
jgi:hypothetical protein